MSPIDQYQIDGVIFDRPARSIRAELQKSKIIQKRDSKLLAVMTRLSHIYRLYTVITRRRTLWVFTDRSRAAEVTEYADLLIHICPCSLPELPSGGQKNLSIELCFSPPKNQCLVPNSKKIFVYN